MNLRLKSRIVLIYGNQTEFASHVNLSDHQVSRVIHNRVQLDSDGMARWAKALRCQPSDIFDIVK